VACQATISSRICSESTWELAANLTIDQVEPSSWVSLRQILLSIPSQTFSSTPLFHTVNRTWRSINGISLTFHPENEADARLYIAGLVPFMKDSAHLWFLNNSPRKRDLDILHLNETQKQDRNIPLRRPNWTTYLMIMMSWILPMIFLNIGWHKIWIEQSMFNE